MLRKKDLEQLDYLDREIKYYDNKIANYKPAEVVVDSVRASSAQFPFIQHTVLIEGLEKKTGLDEYYEKRNKFKRQLQEKKKQIEDKLEEIDDPKIRLIINFRYFDRMTWNDVAKELDMSSEDSARMCLNRYFESQEEKREC